MKCAQNIKKLRTNAGLSQHEFARLLKVPQPSITRWENGTVTPSLQTVEKMAHILQVSADAILFTKEDKEKLKTSSKALTARIKRIEKLSYKDQQAIYQIIDAFLKTKE